MKTTFFSQTKQKKYMSTLGVIGASLVLAVGINLFILDDGNISENLKTSVLNARGVEVNSDIYIDITADSLTVNAYKDIKQAKELSFSLVNNPENVILNGFSSNVGTLTRLNNTPGITTIIITFDAPQDIQKWNRLIEFKSEKNNQDLEQINMIQANFTDNEDRVFNITTSGIDI